MAEKPLNLSLLDPILKTFIKSVPVIKKITKTELNNPVLPAGIYNIEQENVISGQGNYTYVVSLTNMHKQTPGGYGIQYAFPYMSGTVHGMWARGCAGTTSTSWTSWVEFYSSANLPTSLRNLTASITELNYSKGVTSNIQTQLNGKAASTHSHTAAQIGAMPITKITNANTSLDTLTSPGVYHFNFSTSKSVSAENSAALYNELVYYERGYMIVQPSSDGVAGGEGVLQILYGAYENYPITCRRLLSSDGEVLSGWEVMISSGDLDAIVNKIRKTATKVVGTSKSFHTLDICDYLCDGTGDQTEIQNAINALPSTGGKVVLLEGTYNIDAQININKSNVVIEGMGMRTTVLKIAQGSGAVITALIDVNTSCSNADIRHLSLIKDVTRQVNYGIISRSDNVTISDVEVNGFGWGVQPLGNRFSFSELSVCNNTAVGINLGGSYGIVSNCKVFDNEIGICSEGKYHLITGNHVMRGTGQASDYSSSQYTLITRYGAVYNYFTNNYIPGKNYTNSATDTASNTFANNRYQ